MRRPRKSRQAPSAAQQASQSPRAGPFGAWAQADLWALPRFPDRDSFPRAKELINRFLRDALTYRDLRIALFWLGFGLLEVPTPERPAMSLVPLCKDLDTYAETAAELGYDPGASVHARPVCPRDETAQRAAGLLGAAVGAPEGLGPSSSSSSQGHSSSSSSAPGAPAASSAGPPAPSGLGPTGGLHWTEEEHAAEEGERARPSFKGSEGLWLAAEDAEEADFGGKDDEALYYSDEENQDGDCGARGGWPSSYYGVAAAGDSSLPGGGGASSWQWDEEDAEGIGDAASQVLAYKVKLLHAGGWSSSSGSEGNSTPPTPPASSSAAGTAAEAQQVGGGLNADHVGQFTVSFVSDLQLHEELEETSCLCCFCLDDMKIGEELCRLPCMHTFHRHCVYAWLERDRRCMLCRLDVTRPCG
mmetsp:Transcript_52164/g.167109  ORF Transcript_52164/g.167109 Transcript_52164/m.167109 type:complete len:416 (-) Transcript_52164:7-1254(-)